MFSKRLSSLGVFLVLAAVGSGLLLAQSPQAVGTWVGVGVADNPFGNGASVAMTDGRTLIVGGAGPDGAPTNVVSSFDAATNQFAIAGTLLSARTGHTATLLKDGRVLVTGGITNGLVSTDIELFDPSTGASALVAQMAEPRRGHVAALLQNGSVVIAGGYTTEDVVLQSAFVFDPATNAISPTPAGMNVARASASATSLIDGRVVIIGGTSDGTNDLRSAEIFDPALQSFTTVSTQLSVPLRGHSAVLLPNNGSVLVAGGTSNGVTQAGADLFLPTQFPDPFSWGVGEFSPTGAMSAARSSAIAGPTVYEGYSIVTGGGSNGVERYRFATIKTDKDDYAPGNHALITGTGWQPGEQVTLQFQEDPAVHDDYVLTLTANAQGSISTNQWAPEEHDLNVRFYLMATGQQSGHRAQTTFTDSINVAIDNAAFVWHRTGEVAGGFNVTGVTGTYTCNTQGSSGNQCTSVTNVTITVDGATGSKAITGLAPNVNNAAWGPVTLEFRTSPGAGQFTIPPDGRPMITATLNTNATNGPTSGSRNNYFGVDNTAPVTSIQCNGAACTNPYNVGVQVTLSASDVGAQNSGVASTLYCVDTTNTCTPNLPNPGAGGFPVTSSPGVTRYVRYFSTDAVGNVETTKSQTIQFQTSDTTAPLITPNVSGTLGSNDWYVSNVAVSWTVTDAESTISSSTGCGPTTITSDTASTTLTCTATSAGGTSSQSVTIKRDATAPSISASRSPAANGNGWNNTDVIASYTANGAVSGLVDPPTGTFTFTSEGKEQEHMFTVFDMAGNSASALIGNVNIDKTAPTTTITLVPAPNGDHGWYTSTVKVSVAAADNAGGSGVAETRCVLDPGSVPLTFNDLASGCALAAETDVTSEGTHVVYAASKDAAGNVENVKSTSFKIDKTAPTTTITLDPVSPNGNNDWYTAAVKVTVAATDAGGSGVGEIRCVLDPASPPTTFDQLPALPCAYTGSGANVAANGMHTVYAATKDLAGNVESPVKSTSFKIDTTAPTTTTTLVPAAPNGDHGWYTSTVKVSVAATDNTGGSGVGETRCVLDPSSVPSTFNDLAPGCALAAETDVTSEGTHVVYAASKDAAGNVETVSSTSFKIDKTAPTTTITLDPVSPNGNNAWYISNVKITVAATDNAVGSGVDEIRCVVDPMTPPTTFDQLPSSCDYTGGANVIANGMHTVYAATKDLASNKESPVKSTSFKIDNAPPTTTLTLDPATANGTYGWYISNVKVTVASTDNVNGSGVDGTRCVLDPLVVPASFNDIPAGCAYLGAGADVTTDGSHVVYAASKDVAGNVEAVTSTSFKIDKTNPLVAITSPSNGFATIATTIAVSGTASDATSGLKSLTLNTVLTPVVSGTWTATNIPLACGPNAFTAKATDYAGNNATAAITVTRLCFTFEYLQPLDQSYTGGPVRLNQGKYGRVIPVKGNVKLDGVAQNQAALQGYGLTVVIAVNPVACGGGDATAETLEQYADAGLSNGGTNVFRWSLDGYWIYNLDTKAPPNVKMDIGKCYRLDAYVQDTASPVNRVRVSESPYAIFNPIK